jgi:hypothetical protein
MLTRQAITAVIGIALLGAVGGVVGGAAMVRWSAPRSDAPAASPDTQLGLYPDGTALRRVGAQMILR